MRNRSLFGATAATAIHALSLRDALPISETRAPFEPGIDLQAAVRNEQTSRPVPSRTTKPFRPAASGGVCDGTDRKSTRLNSSHQITSYAVFCLKKKKHG